MIFETLGALGGAAGGILGQLLNYSSAQSINSTNRRIARENRQWMEKMANTAHQREVEDLRAAGLNPILSATGGSGAATPSADTSVNLRTPEFGDFGLAGAAKGLSTALELEKSDATVDLARNQAEDFASAAALNKAKAATERFETDIKRAEAMYSAEKQVYGSRKAFEDYRKAIADADAAADKANMIRRDWNFENSAYGRALYHAKRTKETYKNGIIGDIAGTIQSDVMQLLGH